MRWNETGTCPGKGKIQKGPYFPRSWSLANPLLPQRSILCQPTALLCSDPAKRREGERFREDRKEESSQDCQEPVTEMQKAKPGLLVTSVTRWFIQTAPFPLLPTPAAGLHSFASKCNLVNCHCTSASETGRQCPHKKIFFWTLKSCTKGLTLASERSFTFKFAIVVAALCHLQWKSTLTPPAGVWSRNQPPAFMC